MANAKIKIKKDDTIEVISGRDKGKKGKVIKVFASYNRVLVADVNLRKKALREQDKVLNKNFAEREVPIHISNVMLVCPSCKKATRIGRREDENHTRFCKKCDKNID